MSIKGSDLRTTPRIPRRADRRSTALSFAQQRLWFLDQLEPNSPLYNIPIAMRLRGGLSVEALQQSLNAILARHEALRTSFVTVSGNPVQVIGESLPVEFGITDLSHAPRSEREANLQYWLKEQVRRPFNLSADLMLRAHLARLGEEEHLLLLVMHHIAADGWSRGVLFREITAFYESFSKGESCLLPELPIQYADYADWQRQWLRDEILEKQLSYWKEKLKGVPALELPTDRTRGPVERHCGARRSRVLPKPLVDGLKQLSRREGVTLFITMLAAWQALLHRYTGQQDIPIGSPIAGRNDVETEKLIGFFVNTLVLRTDLSGDPTFRQLIARARTVVFEAYEHQDLPFEKLVEELRPDRNRSHSPLFQVMFAFQNLPGQSLELSGLSLSPVAVDSETAKFDLTLFIQNPADRLEAVLEYDTDLFEEGTIQRMLGHFETLLEGIVENADCRVSELPILTEGERQRVLVQWNATGREYPKDKCIHELFEEQAERTPEAVGVEFEDRRLTYRELNQKANQLAHHLKKLGIGSDMLVGICVERSLEMVVGLLGILKAGGVYVPLDPGFPRERLALMLEDARVKVIVTEQKLVEELPGHDVRAVCLDSDWSAVGRESQENLPGEAAPQSRAYVIYTSGSTGKPKGVEITHGSVVNFLSSMAARPGMTQRDVMLAVTTISFDIAGLELYLPLTVGGRVVIASREVAMDGVRLSRFISDCQATVMQATPATWRMMIDAGWQGSKGLKILCGGEALSGELARQLVDRGESLWNLYGPTETTIWSGVYRVAGSGEGVPIGRPIANTEIYILDQRLQPVPIGVPGELCIGGAGVARGYLNRPELTAEKFIVDPFGAQPGARLYRTGDLARYLADGNIECLGRIDHQVKVRGFRVELGEIEAVLFEHRGVREAVVVARDDMAGGKQLIAYVAAAQGAQAAAGELRQHLQQKLPDYMIPSAFVFVESLPLTPNGKIDRRALPVPDQTSRDAGRDYVAPTQTVEHQLVHIWEELLTARPIGIRDSFFDLGGHSLLAAKMVQRIEEVCGEKIPLSILLAAPTIEHLAKELVGGVKNRGAVAVKIQGGSRPPLFFLPADLYGGGFYCLELARGLGADQPFYTLPPYGIDDRPRPPTVEAMAAEYIEMLRAVVPHGPYVLGGLCHGGLVAFEMAQQLQRQGEKTNVVVMVGPMPSNPSRLRFLHDVACAVERLLGLGQEKKLFLKLRGCWLEARQLYRHAVRRLRAMAVMPLGQQAKWALREVRRAGTFQQRRDEGNDNASRDSIPEGLQKLNQAVATYVRRPYSGRVEFFWPIEEPANMPDEPAVKWNRIADKSLGWSRVAKNLEFCAMPGSYVTLVTKDIEILVDWMKTSLNKDSESRRATRFHLWAVCAVLMRPWAEIIDLPTVGEVVHALSCIA